MKTVFIKGISAISPQATFQKKVLEDEIIVTENNFMRCIEPSYLSYLNPVMARRMGRIVKMGIVSAISCLEDAKVSMPGAIITGTALGCLGDTEKFLTSVIEDDEQFLTPTHFIQSIQNTVSGQIALQLNCTNHNFTFVHRGFSFESALLDAIMMLNENEANDILVGGLDEMTEKNFHIYNRLGNWKKELIPSNELLQHKTPGTISGEGSCFFVVSKDRSDDDYAVLKDVKTIYNPDVKKLESEINSLLNENHLNRNEISLVLYGNNGDSENDFIFDKIKDGMMKNIPAGYFKHLCGEYHTSGAFALWLAATSCLGKIFPKSAMPYSNENLSGVDKILIVNRYERDFSLMLVVRI